MKAPYTKSHKNRRVQDNHYFRERPWLKPDHCECCSAKPEDLTTITFHHASYEAPRIGLWLCLDCHRAIHGLTPR